MDRIVYRRLPDGTNRQVYPFHASIEGLEKAILCRDREDYSTMVKYIAVCAHRKNVIVIIYAVVSNHCHVALLAASQADADDYVEELKRVYSQWFSGKYGASAILRRNDGKALLIESDWHLRNALAYIPRNAMDNGANVTEYPWSGYRAMFSSADEGRGRPVRLLTKRQWRTVMHTSSSIEGVPWRIDDNDDLIPGSFCDCAYLEQAFNSDQAFFMRIIGGLDSAEMKETLIDSPRRRLPDSELYKLAEDNSLHWFSTELAKLPIDKKYRLLSFVSRTHKTTVPQLSRVFGLERDRVTAALRKRNES